MYYHFLSAEAHPHQLRRELRTSLSLARLEPGIPDIEQDKIIDLVHTNFVLCMFLCSN